MHGLGNDFVIIDNRVNKITITKELISKLSDRKSGAGCDQLITINSSLITNEDAIIEIFNPDGDRAEACGNGTRCVAKLLFDESSKTSLNIKSDAGILRASKKDDTNISVNLGKISTHWKKIPLSQNIDTSKIPIEIEGFEKVALNLSISETSPKNGDMGWVSENAISENLKSKIINTSPGNVTEPILLPVGILFLKVRDKRKIEKNTNLEEVKDKLVKNEKVKILKMHSLSHFDKLKRSISIKYY